MSNLLWVVYVLRLAIGVLSIQASNSPVSPERALAYAAAAAQSGLAAGEDPYELVGLARNESDFNEDLIGPDGKDCGITQTRITISRYRCRELRRDIQIAFREAARELSEYRQSCRNAG